MMMIIKNVIHIKNQHGTEQNMNIIEKMHQIIQHLNIVKKDEHDGDYQRKMSYQV
jgi:ribosomal protein S15P/S13E